MHNHMKKAFVFSVFVLIVIPSIVSCQKESGSSKLGGTWKIVHQTENISGTVSGISDSESFNYDLSNSDLFLTFVIEDSDIAVLEKGTVTLSHGIKTVSTGFSYSSTSNKIGFDKSLSISSVEAVDEKNNQKFTLTYQTPKEFDVKELSSRKMILVYTVQTSTTVSGTVIKANAELIMTLSKVL